MGHTMEDQIVHGRSVTPTHATQQSVTGVFVDGPVEFSENCDANPTMQRNKGVFVDGPTDTQHEDVMNQGGKAMHVIPEGVLDVAIRPSQAGLNQLFRSTCGRAPDWQDPAMIEALRNLNKALEAQLQTSAPLALSWSPVGKFTQMATLMEQATKAAHVFERVMGTSRIQDAISVWGARARKSRLARAYDFALEAFDKADTGYLGRLDAAQAADACRYLHSMLGLEAPSPSEDESTTSSMDLDEEDKTTTPVSAHDSEEDLHDAELQGQIDELKTVVESLQSHMKSDEEDKEENEDGDSWVSFQEWAISMSQTASLPQDARQELARASTELRCACGAWMSRMQCKDCYPSAGAVECDFTGRRVQTDDVWHCTPKPCHPFGFDVGVDSADEYRRMQQIGRLEKRIAERLESRDCVEEERFTLMERRDDLCIQLQAIAAVEYTALNAHIASIENHGAAAHAAADLPAMKERLAYTRGILSRENWSHRYQNALETAEAVVTKMDTQLDAMAHDQLRFKDALHKAREIAKLEAAFDGRARHAEFEGAMAEVSRCADLAKNLEGLQRIDLSDVMNLHAVEAIRRQVFNQLLAPLGHMIQIVGSEQVWTDGGIKFTLEILTPTHPTGQKLEHVVPMDNRDMENFKMHNKFANKYHEVQERLSGLSQCATDADLDACVEQITCDGSEGMCVICQDDFSQGETATRLAACGHVFHKDCIDHWLLGCKRECPTCKAELGPRKPPSPTKEEDAKEEDVAEPEESEVPEEPERLVEEAQQPERVPETYSAVYHSRGTQVRFEGLQGRADLNGTVGVVQAWIEDRGRYRIQTDGGETVAVRPGNVSAVVDSPAEAEAGRAEDEEGHMEEDMPDVAEVSSDDEDADEEERNLAQAIAMSLQSAASEFATALSRSE